MKYQIQQRRKVAVAICLPIWLLGVGFLMYGRSRDAHPRNKNNQNKDYEIIFILPNNQQKGDLNQDGLFPDVYLETENGRKIPFFSYQDEKGQRYVSSEFMQQLHREEGKLNGKIDYQGIERKVNEK